MTHNYSHTGYTTHYSRTKTTNAPQSDIFKVNPNFGQNGVHKYSPTFGLNYGSSDSLNSGISRNITKTNSYDNSGLIKGGHYVTTGRQPGVNYEVTVGIGKPVTSSYIDSNIPSNEFGVTSSKISNTHDRYTTNTCEYPKNQSN